MPDHVSSERGIDIHPTPSPAYSDTSLTQLFMCHIHLINSERQAIWQRNAAMIIANSFMLSTLSISSNLAVVGGTLGTVLCILWLIMTWRGWSYFHQQLRAARRFRWPGVSIDINPLAMNRIDDLLANARHDRIFIATIAMIIAFLVTHPIAVVAQLGWVPPGWLGQNT